MLRLLPYVIICLLLFLGSKLLEMVDQDALNILSSVQLKAAGTAEQLELKFDDEEFGLMAASEPVDFNSVQKAVQENKILEAPAPATTSEKLEEEGGAVQQNKEEVKKLAASTQSFKKPNKEELSPMALDMLQELKARREELEYRENELLLKTSALAVAQEDLQKKLDRLTKLQGALEVALRKYEAKEKEKTLKLVKIYESMKPADAAKIFEDMQTNLLLDVVEQMKEARVAPIFASMDPVKAKELTIALINRRKTLQTE